MEDAEKGFAVNGAPLFAHVVAQMLIAVLDLARRVGAPDLLRNRFGEHAQLALALADLKIGTLERDCSLAHLDLELVSGDADCVLRSLARGADNGDCDRAEDEGGQKALRLLGYRDGEERRDEEVGDEQRRFDDGYNAGDDSAEPGAAHDGAEEQKDERIGDDVLKRKGPQERDKHKAARDGDGLDAVVHRPAWELADRSSGHGLMILVSAKILGHSCFPWSQKRDLERPHSCRLTCLRRRAAYLCFLDLADLGLSFSPGSWVMGQGAMSGPMRRTEVSRMA